VRERGERDEVITGVNEKTEESSGMSAEERAQKNGRYASVAEAKTIKGDRWSGYRYTL
jgi:hypothetical protein